MILSVVCASTDLGHLLSTFSHIRQHLLGFVLIRKVEFSCIPWIAQAMHEP